MGANLGIAKILYTADGGATWTDQLEGQYPFALSAIALIDGGVATAVGSTGLILRTVTGGLPD